jgi:hypothetical protein
MREFRHEHTKQNDEHNSRNLTNEKYLYDVNSEAGTVFSVNGFRRHFLSSIINIFLPSLLIVCSSFARHAIDVSIH